MEKKDKCPSYDEYKELVKSYLDSLSGEFTTEELEKYINENDEMITDRYNADLERYNNGELPLNIFVGDCIGSVAYCLYLMA